MKGNQEWKRLASKQFKHVPSGLCLEVNNSEQHKVTEERSGQLFRASTF